MSTGLVAYIPARGGSKSIPRKNIRLLAGRPLINWTLAAATESSAVDRVFVGTDSPEIAQVALDFGHPKVAVVDRPPETATDHASTESALLDFAGRHDFGHVALLQATSPLTTARDLDAAWASFCSSGADSLLSVVRQKRFLWNEAADGTVSPGNYHPGSRPRRQDWNGFLVENGAFYLCTRSGLLSSRCRLHGKTIAHEMAEESYLELDEPCDWDAIAHLLRSRSLRPAPSPRDIRIFLTDVDGVLTDGGMYYDASGDTLKKFNTRDGHGLALLRAGGVLTGFVTGEDTPINASRAAKLGISILAQGVRDKASRISEILRAHGLEWRHLAYIGDDVNDLEALRLAGWSAAPSDAEPAVREAVHHLCERPGGRGCVREFIDLILKMKPPQSGPAQAGG
jgi:YrbI family 3-deoxy-D-manno-octulosonate 8-phosphate phosphatase